MFFKTDVVNTYVAEYYPNLPLHPAMVSQLMWLQGNSVNTSQSSIQAKKDLVNLEVKRILSRYHCLLLLQRGRLRRVPIIHSSANRTTITGIGFIREIF